MTKVYVPAGMLVTFVPSGSRRLMTYELWRPDLPIRTGFVVADAEEISTKIARKGSPQRVSRLESPRISRTKIEKSPAAVNFFAKERIG